MKGFKITEKQAMETSNFLRVWHCVKSVCIRSYSGPYFPAFRPEQLRIRTLFTQCGMSSYQKIEEFEQWRAIRASVGGVGGVGGVLAQVPC